MMTTLRTGNTIAALGVAVLSAGVLWGTIRAAINHEIGNLGLLVTGQVALLALVFVPAVLRELSDRQTLSIYRAMREAK